MTVYTRDPRYWPALQLAADSYVFDIYNLLEDPGRWDTIAAITEDKNIGCATDVLPTYILPTHVSSRSDDSETPVVLCASLPDRSSVCCLSAQL